MKQRKSIRLTLLPLAFASVLLSGCGDKVLDFRNAQLNNGKVYAGDSNTPFSGKVTNVPAGTILGSQQGYGKLLNTVNAARPSTTLGDMGMSSMCDAQARDGLLSGKAVCKTPQSDTTRIEANFTDGVLDGSFTVHDKTGNNTFVELSFKQGMPDGKMKIFSPATGKLAHTAMWNAGVINGEEEGFDETTGNRVLHATVVNGKYDGELTRYAPDGKQVIYKADFAQGQHEGDEETFDPQTGKMTGQAHYTNGKLDGVVRHWNADGSPLDEKTYENGVDVAAAKAASEAAAAAEAKLQREPQDIEACVSKRREEVTQRNGGFAPPAAEMTWRDECKRELDAAIADVKANVSPQPAPSQPTPTSVVQ
ncbi:toxin-antitoxin system YwqK family antitoxin [Paraburkholderia tagetis]|uniref:Toxin-antitoxin system YwqK family antitoxin n=1 Tax=Paraburkholderia tagetis TaxID=2913261 RepID=A0A9X1RUR1_9BURK|nr:toxin-antitoxin system YwqK family antitoxin [Paraburkholderia tagetis]MCG5076491.1 toxin-antitoxin system YwqK family antitoxin [Paraburkholderia tagetis]